MIENIAVRPLNAFRGFKPGPGQEPPHRKLMHGPVEKLIAHRAELQLTDEQVSRLEEIDARMRERNRPYVQRLIQLRHDSHFDPHVRREEMTPEQRAEFERRVAEVRRSTRTTGPR